jgi:hypothetical protein
VRYRADAGGVIVMPYGDHYVMGGEGTAACVSILSLLDPLPWEVMPVLRHGGGGRRTEIRTDAADDPGAAGPTTPAVSEGITPLDGATGVEAVLLGEDHTLTRAGPSTGLGPGGKVAVPRVWEALEGDSARGQPADMTTGGASLGQGNPRTGGIRRIGTCMGPVAGNRSPTGSQGCLGPGGSLSSRR